jgi:hypothetical protein
VSFGIADASRKYSFSFVFDVPLIPARVATTANSETGILCSSIRSSNIRGIPVSIKSSPSKIGRRVEAEKKAEVSLASAQCQK